MALCLKDVPGLDTLKCGPIPNPLINVLTSLHPLGKLERLLHLISNLSQPATDQSALYRDEIAEEVAN
jgi:hypothetical protein